MLPDGWHLTHDVDDFLARAGDFLRSRPALHNTPLTDIEKLRTPGPLGHDAEAAVLGLLEAGGRVRAILYLTPHGRLGLTPLSPEQTDALAAHLAGLGLSPPTSSRTTTPPAAFAEAWQRHTGAASLPFWRTHLYRLGTLTPRCRGRRARGASWAPGTASRSCAGAVSSVSMSGNSPPST